MYCSHLTLGNPPLCNVIRWKLQAWSGLDWDSKVFEPFLKYQVSYGILKTKFLSSSLPDPSPQDDLARELQERMLDVFSLGKESLSQMQSFTHGFGTTALVSSLDEFLSTFRACLGMLFF